MQSSHPFTPPTLCSDWFRSVLAASGEGEIRCLWVSVGTVIIIIVGKRVITEMADRRKQDGLRLPLLPFKAAENAYINHILVP